MIYESLFLPHGGGIICENHKVPQIKNRAALVIGIGGTGIETLAKLKGKLYRYLQPNNPGDPNPRYDGIQLLAVDTDIAERTRYQGLEKLEDSEFFLLNTPEALAELKNPEALRHDSRMNWMDDRYHSDWQSSNHNIFATGSRQIGRYFLISNAIKLINVIQRKCSDALYNRGANALDIYIFTGIAGGTGGGCFLDVCYLVRKVLEANCWNGMIHGLMFLPDVYSGHPSIPKNGMMMQHLNSNGFAALKELDYLMSLRDNHDWFYQYYGSDLTIRTQQSPMDVPYILSGCRADGSLVSDGYYCAVNTASDYVIACLADVEAVENCNGGEPGFSMFGRIMDVFHVAKQLPKSHGANNCYCVLGAAYAQVPTTQIHTYLAAGCFKRFREAMYKPKSVVTKNAVDKFAASMHFAANDIFTGILKELPDLKLPEVDRRDLRDIPVQCRGTAPAPWAAVGNNWLIQCSFAINNAQQKMVSYQETYDITKINGQSLIGRLFRKLVEISLAPEFGPYYAASLLKNNEYDLRNALDGQIDLIDGTLRNHQIGHEMATDNMMECHQTFHDRSSRRNYDIFYRSVTHWYLTEGGINQLRAVGEILRTFRNQVQELYDNFFSPLCRMLDNLWETFDRNSAHLNTRDAGRPHMINWHLVNLEGIRPRLDMTVDSLNMDSGTSRFVDYLLTNSDAWLEEDQNKIAQLISRFILDLFQDETSRSLEEYLYDKFPDTLCDPMRLAQKVENDILPKIVSGGNPMFWCDSSYPITDRNFAIACCHLLVPGNCGVVCMAAENFAQNANLHIIRTGSSDGMFLLRVIGGVPLFACMGINRMKADYDDAAVTYLGVGTHLYSYTGRGEDGTGHKDWRNMLPSPIPCSREYKPNDEERMIIELYQEAVSRGIIREVSDADSYFGKRDYFIFASPDFTPREYCLEDFSEDGVFIRPAYDEEISKLRSERHRWDNHGVNRIPLKNDGDPSRCDPETVRIDYFIKAPVLQEIVRKEIEKSKAIEKSLEQLTAIRAGNEDYNKDLKTFCELLFCRKIVCEDSLGGVSYKRIANIYFEYTDKFGDTARYDLSSRERGDIFAKAYPLYQAFIGYRNLDHTKNLYKELEEAAEKFRKAEYTEEDSYVPAVLEQFWTNNALEELRKTKLKIESAADQQSILRFYEGLIQNIREFKSVAPTWPKDKSAEYLTELLNSRGAQEESPDSGNRFWVHYEGESLLLCSDLTLRYVWSLGKKKWVPLNAKMYIWLEERWQPVRLDDAGNIIL